VSKAHTLAAEESVFDQEDIRVDRQNRIPRISPGDSVIRLNFSFELIPAGAAHWQSAECSRIRHPWLGQISSP